MVSKNQLAELCKLAILGEEDAITTYASNLSNVLFLSGLDAKTIQLLQANLSRLLSDSKNHKRVYKRILKDISEGKHV